MAPPGGFFSYSSLFLLFFLTTQILINEREKKSTKSQPMRNLNRSRKLPQCVLLVKKKRMNYMLIILSVIETSLKYLISIKRNTLFKVTITVNVFGQYVLSDLCLCLFHLLVQKLFLPRSDFEHVQYFLDTVMLKAKVIQIVSK